MAESIEGLITVEVFSGEAAISRLVGVWVTPYHGCGTLVRMTSGRAITATCVAAGLVGAAIILAAEQRATLALAATGGVAVILWLALPRREGTLPRRLTLLLTAFTFSSVLPGGASAIVQLLALAGAYLEWLFVPSTERRGSKVVWWCTAVIALWSVLIFHPNVPSLATGALGFRKTVLALAGVVLGCAVRRHLVWRAERLVVLLLTGALGVSIAAHLWFPDTSNQVQRGADQYTASLGGVPRLQGIFAGPFHAATAGVFLVGWALIRWREHPRLATLACVIGALGTYLTLVRTAYVAIGLVLLAVVLASPTGRSFVTRFAGVAVVGGLGWFIIRITGGTGTAVSIGDYASDRRFLNRFTEYSQAWDMIERSPVFGWGAGSAGDTLGDEFRAGFEHVTPHNVLLKLAVEGGLVGLFCVSMLALCLVRTIDRRSRPGQLAVIAVVGLLAMGTTGSAIETLPVSYLILMVVGLAVGVRSDVEATQAPPVSPRPSERSRRPAAAREVSGASSKLKAPQRNQ